MRDAGVDPALLEFELTERTLVRDPDAALETIRGFRSTGFGIALDDFGAGQTSLQYLTRFPMQTLKIDKSLVDRMLHDDRSAAIVESVIGLAHRLGLGVVAEGVEAVEQQQYLVGLNCDQIQGFYFSEALCEETFVSSLKNASGATVFGGEAARPQRRTGHLTRL